MLCCCFFFTLWTARQKRKMVFCFTPHFIINFTSSIPNTTRKNNNTASLLLLSHLIFINRCACGLWIVFVFVSWDILHIYFILFIERYLYFAHHRLLKIGTQTIGHWRHQNRLLIAQCVLHSRSAFTILVWHYFFLLFILVYF